MILLQHTNGPFKRLPAQHAGEYNKDHYVVVVDKCRVWCQTLNGEKLEDSNLPVESVLRYVLYGLWVEYKQEKRNAE